MLRGKEARILALVYFIGIGIISLGAVLNTIWVGVLSFGGMALITKILFDTRKRNKARSKDQYYF